MDAWAQLLWDRMPETDAHRDAPRRQYAHREARQVEAAMKPRKLPVTEFISQYAVGDSLAASGELLVRSRQLIIDSRQQILRCRMRLLMSDAGRSIQ